MRLAERRASEQRLLAEWQATTGSPAPFAHVLDNGSPYVERLMQRNRRATRDEMAWAERLDGLHSGIPPCCVEAFIEHTSATIVEFPQLAYWLERGLQYVVCRACAARLCALAE